jgi:hypothetical protein
LPGHLDLDRAQNVDFGVLDAEAVKRGEKFSRKKGTSISQLVSDLLMGLEDEPESKLSPATARLLDAAERGKVDGFVAGHTITTVHYIVARDSQDFSHALVLGISDYGDAVQAAAAARIGASYIATRNEKDFRNSPVTAKSPAHLLAMIEQ